MQINLSYLTTTPATAVADFQAAANMLDSLITDNITINLTVNWSGSGGGASAGPSAGVYEPYSTVYSILTGHASPGDTTFTALPNATSINGASSVEVWNAELKAMGLLSGTATGVDGVAQFSTDISSSLLIGVALHEFGHALGRAPFTDANSSLDISEFFRFTSQGVRLSNNSMPGPAVRKSTKVSNPPSPACAMAASASAMKRPERREVAASQRTPCERCASRRKAVSRSQSALR